ncbi:hypothetical protein [Nonomuraea sp. NPDC003214]
MAEDESVDGGQLELEVVADLDGFEQRLKREVDRRVRDVHARIQARIDARRLEAEARLAARAAERSATIHAGVDRRSLAQSLKNALTSMAGASTTVEVRPEVDGRRMRQEMDRAARAAAPTVPVKTDTRQARNELGQFVKQDRGWLINLAVKIDDHLLRPAEQKLKQLALAAGGAVLKYGALAVAAGVAGSGLLAMAAAASQAVGMLGLLPGVAGVAAQGLAGLMVGLSGVGTALSALAQRDAASGASAASSAAAREAAAERIKQAERSIRDAAHARMLADERVQDARDAAVEASKAIVKAEERVAEAVARVAEARARVGEAAEAAAERQAQAARQVEMAERRVQQSQRATQRAQEDLNEARKQAKERLEDLQLALRGGALDEEGAQIGIERALERLKKVNADPFASDLDKREAALNYKQALLRLDEVKERNQDLAEEKADSDARGIEGSKEVEAAKERLSDAIQAEKDAEDELAQARKDAAKAAVEGAKAVAEAQKGVSEALRNVTEAQEDVKRAQKAEIQAQRDVREALWDQMLAVERLTDAQKELAKARKDAKTAGQTGGAGGVDPAAAALAALSPKMREFVLFLHNEVRPELRKVRDATQDALAPGLQAGVKAAMPLLDTIKSGLSSTGTVIGDLSEDFGELLGSKAFSGYVSRIMGRNNQATQLFGKAGISAFKGITRIVDVSMPYVVKFADRVAGMADRFDKWTKKVRGDGSLDTFFRNAWEAADRVWRIVSNVGSAIMKVAGLALPSGNTLLEDLAQGAEDLNAWLDKPEVQARFKKFFDELVPLLQAAGRLLRDVVVFVGGLVEKIVVDGTLTDFLNWLSGVVRWLDELVQNPVVGEIAKWLVIFALAATAIGLITQKVSGLISGLKTLGKVAKGLSKLTGLSKLFGGGKGKDGGDDSAEVDTVNVDADRVIIDGDTTSSSSSSSKRGRHRRTNGGGDSSGGDVDVSSAKKRGKSGGRSKLSGALAGLFGDVGVDLLDDVDWDAEFKKKGVASKIGSVVGKAGKGGIIGTIAGFVADPIGDAIKGKSNKGLESAVGEALKSGTAGASIGAMVGSVVPVIGTALGGVVGGVLGAAKGGIEGYFGSRTFGAGLKNAFSLDGLAHALKEVGTLFGGAGATVQEKWANMWRGLDKGTEAGASGLSSRLGGLLDVTNGKFATLAKGAPQNIQRMWADIKRDLDAGISPSQAKIDAFVKAGGAGFLKLGKDAPKELQEGWRQALLGVDTFTSTAANKLGVFANTASGKFLTLKSDAPKHVSDMWTDIQSKIASGTPIPQKAIDDFIAAGGGSFLKLRQNAPQAVKDALADINTDLQTGLAQASLKLGGFVTDGNGKFLKMRSTAPAPLKAMWADIQRDIDAGKKPSQDKIDAFVRAGGGSFLKLSKDAPASTKKTWSDIAAGVDPGLKPAKDKVAAVTKDMEKSFGTAKSGIQKVWDAIPDVLRKPVAWIVNTAYRKIQEMWNGIAEAVGFPPLPKVAFADGGIVAKSYGVQPGYAPGRDRMLAAVSPGEAWLRPELARALGSSWVNGGNRAARVGGVSGAARFIAGGLAFAKGGMVSGSGSGSAPAPKKPQNQKKKQEELSPLEKLLQGVSAHLRKLFAKGLGAGARTVLVPIRNAITAAIGDRTKMQQLMARIPAWAIDKVIGRFDQADADLNRDRGGPLPPGRSSVYNGTGRNEWVLTPSAVAALGGPRAVQRLNEGGAAALYRASRRSARPVRTEPQPVGGNTVNVFPQPGQSEVAIGRAASRSSGSRIS